MFMEELHLVFYLLIKFQEAVISVILLQKVSAKTWLLHSRHVYVQIYELKKKTGLIFWMLCWIYLKDSVQPSYFKHNVHDALVNWYCI